MLFNNSESILKSGFLTLNNEGINSSVRNGDDKMNSYTKKINDKGYN